MFGKKILSFIGLLLIFNRFAKVSATAADLRACDVSETEKTDGTVDSPTGYCLEDTTIYKYDGSNKEAIENDVLIFSGNTFIAVANTAASTDYSVYICESSICKRTFGYIKKDGSTYLKIAKDKLAAVDVSDDYSTEIEATGCTIGSLFKDIADSKVKLCISNGIGITLAANAAAISNNLMDNVGLDTGTTIFTNIGVNKEPKLIIQAGTASFLLNTDITDQLLFKDDRTLLNEAGIAALASVSGVHLYDCLAGSCKVTSGYVKYDSGNKFGECIDGNCRSDQTSVDCDADEHFGKINLAASTMKLCITNGSLVGVTEASGKIGYIVGTNLYKINSSGSIIGMLIRIEDGNFVVNNKLYNNNGGFWSLDYLNSGIYPFKKFENDENFWKLLSESDISELNDVSDILLYYCESNSCTKTSGFFKYNSGNSFAECTTSSCITETSVDCNANEHVGKINLAAETMKLCITNGNLVGATEASGKIGYIVDTNLYKINSSGSIIGVSQENESFIDNNSKLTTCTSGECEQVVEATSYYYVYALTNSSIKKLYECTDGSTCEEVEEPSGYYYNESTTKLYFCNGGCHEEPILHGYIFNKESTNKGLICDGDSCEETEDLTKPNCSEDQYKVIYHDGLKYCDGISEIQLPKTSRKYYFVPNVKTNEINYPSNFFSENETGEQIIIELEQFHVIKLNNYAICLKSHDHKNCEEGDTIYVCDTSSPCRSYVYNEESGDCYSSSKNEKCNGYYLDGDELIFCTKGICEGPLNLLGYFKSPNGEFIQCVTFNDSTSTCYTISPVPNPNVECNIGELIENTGDINLCINGKTADSVQIFTKTNDKYFMKAYILRNGANYKKYHILSIDSKSAKVEILTTDVDEYLYTFKNQKILIQKENQCTINEGSRSEDLIEFKCPNIGNQYTYTTEDIPPE